MRKNQRERDNNLNEREKNLNHREHNLNKREEILNKKENEMNNRENNIDNKKNDFIENNNDIFNKDTHVINNNISENQKFPEKESLIDSINKEAIPELREYEIIQQKKKEELENSKEFYDMVLDFSNFEQLKGEGWKITWGTDGEKNIINVRIIKMYQLAYWEIKIEENHFYQEELLEKLIL